MEEKHHKHYLFVYAIDVSNTCGEIKLRNKLEESGIDLGHTQLGYRIFSETQNEEALARQICADCGIEDVVRSS